MDENSNEHKYSFFWKLLVQTKINNFLFQKLKLRYSSYVLNVLRTLKGMFQSLNNILSKVKMRLENETTNKSQ